MRVGVGVVRNLGLFLESFRSEDAGPGDPLRRAVVVLTEEFPPDWDDLARTHPGLMLVQGSPLRTKDLIKARVW